MLAVGIALDLDHFHELILLFAKLRYDYYLVAKDEIGSNSSTKKKRYWVNQIALYITLCNSLNTEDNHIFYLYKIKPKVPNPLPAQ